VLNIYLQIGGRYCSGCMSAFVFCAFLLISRIFCSRFDAMYLFVNSLAFDNDSLLIYITAFGFCFWSLLWTLNMLFDAIIYWTVWSYVAM